ncbi:sigma-54-dependent transcriptional regulator, partial [Rhizobium sp.]|uniref:sigma-54-dependent transcriptional regulator n=1 Tax=Rhizobium sp. TaxID=391 RepID=UPI002F1CED95
MTQIETLRVMLVDDDDAFRVALADSFAIAGLDIETYSDGHSALASLNADFPGVLVTDIRMPRVDGHGVLDAALARDPELPVILMTGHGDIAMAVAALKQGAFDFIAKPFATDHMIASVRRALEMRRLVLENRRLRQAAAEAEESLPLLGETPVMVRLRETIRQLASVNVDVLIEGETGTGKELVARCLHDFSRRHTRQFVALNCGGLPENLFESEIFGHEANAFTGAGKRRIGKIEHADGGTLFLDEVESMPLPLQIKLQRVLQERTLERLGSNQSVAVDCRVIAATKSDLDESSKAGEFRSDLYYRLNVVTLELPPLRERREDILQLFEHFLQQSSLRFDRAAPELDNQTVSNLMSHDWPGNVRELRNVAERFALGLPAFKKPGAGASAQDLTFAEAVEAFERNLLND